MNLFKICLIVWLIYLSLAAYGQHGFSKSFDIDHHTDNGVKVIQIDTLLITHSISACNYPSYDFCTGIVCTNLSGDLKWIRDLDTIRTNGNDGLTVHDKIIYVAAVDRRISERPIRITSFDLEGTLLASVSIANDWNIPAIRGILKIQSGWLLNITEHLSENHRFASLVWLDEEFNIIKKKIYSDLTYHFWVQKLIDLDGNGFVAAGTYRTPDWSQEHSVIKMDADGNIEWSFRLPPPYSSGPTSLAVADDGNFVVTYPLEDWSIVGFFFRPYTIQKVTSEGEVLWRHIFYHTSPQSIAEFIIADNGDIVGVGSNNIDTDQVSEIYGFLFRMTQDGALLWKKSIADYRYGELPFCYFNNLAELDNGDLIMTGLIEDSIAIINPSQEILNTWLVRTDANGCIYEACEDLTQVVSIRNVSKKKLSLFELWPTVSTDWIEVVPRGVIAENNQWTVRVMNVAGQRMQHRKVDTFPYKLSVNDYPPGIYFVQLENAAGAFQILKLIKI